MDYDLETILDDFHCSLSRKLFSIPRTTNCEHTFEEKEIKKHSRCPECNTPLTTGKLNYKVKDFIDFIQVQVLSSESSPNLKDMSELIKDFSLENYSCSISRKLFSNPVIINCGHTFEKEAITKWWREEKDPACPECKKPITSCVNNQIISNFINALIVTQPSLLAEQYGHRPQNARGEFVHHVSRFLSHRIKKHPRLEIGHSLKNYQQFIDEPVNRCEDTTVLHFFISTQSLSGVQQALKLGADINKQDSQGETAIIMAIQSRSNEIVDELLKNELLDLTKSTKDGLTALHWAAFRENGPLCQTLIHRGASMTAVEKYGRKPVDYASEKTKKFFPNQKERLLNLFEVVRFPFHDFSFYKHKFFSSPEEELSDDDIMVFEEIEKEITNIITKGYYDSQPNDTVSGIHAFLSKKLASIEEDQASRGGNHKLQIQRVKAAIERNKKYLDPIELKHTEIIQELNIPSLPAHEASENKGCMPF